MTTYILLRRVDEDATWEQIGYEVAASPKAALRQYHDASPITSGVYAAVPERNWTDLTPELVTETRLVFR